MALILKDRVKETTTTTGTSDFALSGAVTGHQVTLLLVLPFLHQVTQALLLLSPQEQSRFGVITLLVKRYI